MPTLCLGAKEWIDFRESMDLVADIKAATGGQGPHTAVITAATSTAYEQAVDYLCKERRYDHGGGLASAGAAQCGYFLHGHEKFDHHRVVCQVRVVLLVVFYAHIVVFGDPANCICVLHSAETARTRAKHSTSPRVARSSATQS